MRRMLVVICACVVALAAGCYVAGLKASYRTEDEEAAVELDEGRIECPADTALATR